MRLYKPTIYRLAAEEILNGVPYSCVAIKCAVAKLINQTWSSDYRLGFTMALEFEKQFMPEECESGSVWFGSDNEHRALSLLLMAEITKGQYFTVPQV